MTHLWTRTKYPHGSSDGDPGEFRPGGPSFAIAKGGVTMIEGRNRFPKTDCHHPIGQHPSKSIGRTEPSPKS
jgi:hypothetical protein